jgi:hypothetical protein
MSRSRKATVSTAGGSNLNRILRTTANLLFEKGEDPASVMNLLQGFVAPAMIRKWHQRYQETHGLTGADTSKKAVRRMPMPPIDFNAIELKSLEQLLEPEIIEEDEEEPNW